MKNKFDIPEMLRRNPKTHMAVFSITRGGKSYFVQKYLDVPFRRGIHYDYLGKPSDSQLKYYAETSEEAIAYMEELNTFSLTTDNLGEIIDHIKIVYPLLRDMNYNEPVFMAFDEIQYYSDDETLDMIFHTGKKYNIVGIAIARNLQDIQKRSVSVISQCDDIVLCGGITDITRTKMKNNYSIDVPDHVFEWVNQTSLTEDKYGGIMRESKHNYAWFDRRKWDLYGPDFRKVKL